MLMTLAHFANGQDAGITATTTPRSDGSYTDTVTNPDDHVMTITDYTLGSNHLIKHISRKVVYALDAQNQPTYALVYDAKGRLTMKSRYVRDAMNRIAEEYDYTPKNQLLCKIVYEFDVNNRIIGMHAFDPKGNPIPLPSESNRTRR